MALWYFRRSGFWPYGGKYFGTFVSTFLALSSRPSDPDPCVPQVTFTKFENLKLILTGLVSLSLFLPQSSTWSIFDVFTMKLFNSFVKVTRKALHGFKFFIVFLSIYFRDRIKGLKLRRLMLTSEAPQ